MADAMVAQPAVSSAGAGESRRLFAVVAWRNLWRNPRRTWLTAGGTAFAILLVVLMMSLQAGMYDPVIDSSSRLGSGHVQVQHPSYHEDPRLRSMLRGGTELVRILASLPGVVAVAPRAEAFALFSAGVESEERSFGARLVGVDPELEPGVSDFARRVTAGNFLRQTDDVVLGAGLARNLGASVGDEVVVLGTGREGGVAALGLTVGGIFETGMTDLDRSMAMLRLADMQEAFGLGDDVHRVVLRGDGIEDAGELSAGVRGALGDGDEFRVLTWNDLMPEMEQAMRLDGLSGVLMYWMLLILVGFAIVNALVMTAYERTREFGMLLAIGMRPASVMAMLQVEALAMWALGVAIGMAAVAGPVWFLQAVGVPFPEGTQEASAGFALPERVHARLDVRAAAVSPLALLVVTLAAAGLASLRLRTLRPVDALRERE